MRHGRSHLRHDQWHDADDRINEIYRAIPVAKSEAVAAASGVANSVVSSAGYTIN